MPARLDVAVVQAPVATPGENLDLLEATLAAHPGLDVIVFPELFLPGYDLDGIRGRASAPDGDALGRVKAAARRAGSGVVVGFAEPDGDTLFNSAAIIDRTGALVAVYRKTHLFGRESEVFASGDAIGPADSDGRRLGPLICYDLEFPEVARTLALGGAELLVAPTANMLPYGADHRAFAIARALENRIPLLYANVCGTTAEFEFVGESCIVDHDGRVLAELGESPGIVTATLDLPDAVPADVDYLAHRRPELYR